MSWHASLASSAVLAAEEVRKTVKAFRIASKAKLAAKTAAKLALDVYNSQEFSTDEEAEAVKARVSTTQSDAIHAAVIEHEALSAKRKAAVALARDVRYWNIHRKREILSTCIEAAKAQQKAANETANAWTQLREGLLDLSAVPLLVRNKSHEESIEMECPQRNAIENNTIIDDSPFIIPPDPYTPSNDVVNPGQAEQKNIESIHSKNLNNFSDAVDDDARFGENDLGLPDSTLLEELSSHSYLDTSQSLFKEIEKDVLSVGYTHSATEIVSKPYESADVQLLSEGESVSERDVKLDSNWSEDFDELLSEVDNDERITNHALNQGISSHSLNQDNENALNIDQASQSSSFHDAIEDGVGQILCEGETNLEWAHPQSGEDNIEVSGGLLVEESPKVDVISSEENESSNLDETTTGIIKNEENLLERNSKDDQNAKKSIDIESKQKKDTVQELSSSERNQESMTDSMQSLVDGLMTWGGQWDSDDDISLPFGMAASLAIEEKKRQGSKRTLLKND